jgi:hypothetical protein
VSCYRLRVGGDRGSDKEGGCKKEVFHDGVVVL